MSAPIHENWSGVVTASRPSRAGEVISVYAVGLGLVDRAVATGAQGPSNPPARVAGELHCNADVLFAGLAPGLVGYYQISFRVPESGSGGTFRFTCPGMLLDVEVAIRPTALSAPARQGRS